MAGPKVLRLDLTVALPDEPPTDLLTAVRARRRPLFADAVRAVRAVATTRGLAGVVARVGGPGAVLTMSQAQELRAAVATVTAAGKPALGFAETFGEFGPGTVAYLGAAAFDELWLQPSGDLGLTGFALSTVFARDALDRLGVHARIGQRHEFKNAPDTLLSRGYSEPHREALAAVAEALLAQVADAVATDRARLGVTAEGVRELTGTAPLTPEAALAAGLVDRVGYRDEFAARVRERLGADTRFLDVAGALTESRGRTLPPVLRVGGHPTLALVSVTGGIRTGRSGRSALTGAAVGSDTVAAALRSAAHEKSVAGVVLRVDSPGGSYLASDTIHREVGRLRALGKPVVAAMGTYAASGGYFVAMAADRVLAQPGTLTGSIGVFGGKVVTRELTERYGITRDAVTAGGHGRLFSGAVDYDDGEWELINAWLDRVYDDFTGKAAADRGLSVEHVRDVARGRVWVGADALGHGLVDGLGGLDDARRAAAELTGLDPERTPLRRLPATDLVSRLRAARGGGPHQPVGTLLPAVLPAPWPAVAGGADIVCELLALPAASGLREVADAVALLSAGAAGALTMAAHLTG